MSRLTGLGISTSSPTISSLEEKRKAEKHLLMKVVG